MAESCELPVEHRRAANLERGFVQAPEAPRPAACEDGCRPHERRRPKGIRKMNRAGVGRMLVASLHQGISDLMPTRLEFYENWLHATGMRDGRIGLAPLAAVLSFLRQEGEP